MQLTGIRQMEMQDITKPVIKNSHDVLIKMGTIGVCGSDIHYYTTGKIGDQFVQYPFRVGHECAGIVEETGKAVTSVKKGDRIAVDPAMSCFNCDQCNAGRYHTCRNLKFLGCPGQAEGCLAEYIVMPEHSCYPIPDNLDMDQAAISEPLSIGLYGVKQSIDLKNASAGILGFGPIGMSVLLAGIAFGGKKFYVTDKIDSRLNLAEKTGATYTGNPTKHDVVNDIIKQEPLELDVIYECCGKQEAIDQAVDMLKPGGKLMLIGIPETDHIYFQPEKIRRKEINIQNVRRQVDCVQPALDMISSGKISVDDMQTHRFSFAQTQTAFDLVENYRDGVMKAIIDFRI